MEWKNTPLWVKLGILFSIIFLVAWLWGNGFTGVGRLPAWGAFLMVIGCGFGFGFAAIILWDTYAKTEKALSVVFSGMAKMAAKKGNYYHFFLSGC